MAFERPFPDIPLFEDYHRITNRSEQPSTSVSLLVNAMAERCFLMKPKKITYVIFKKKKKARYLVLHYSLWSQLPLSWLLWTQPLPKWFGNHVNEHCSQMLSEKFIIRLVRWMMLQNAQRRFASCAHRLLMALSRMSLSSESDMNVLTIYSVTALFIRKYI